MFQYPQTKIYSREQNVSIPPDQKAKCFNTHTVCYWQHTKSYGCVKVVLANKKYKCITKLVDEIKFKRTQ